MASAATSELYERLRAQYQSAGQSHVFAFWHQLNADQQQILLDDAQHVRVETIAPLYHTVIEQERANNAAAATSLSGAEQIITPFDNVTVLAGHPQRNRWYSDGLAAIRAGTVAAVLMAGGAGTRLGSSAPKGCFNIGMPSHSSLFQLQANRIRRLRTLAADNSVGGTTSVSVPWYIMTSVVTHDATIAYFDQHKYFGLPQSDVFFFQQRELPALTLDESGGDDRGGRIMMEQPYKISLSPNGNGGIFDALKTSGAVADMSRRGIEHIHVYGVDNALVKVADPTLIGYAISVKAQCVNKVVLKTDPAERVGVMCLRNGKPSVVEYSEISKEMSEQRQPETEKERAGQLVYSAGNIVQHYFTLAAVQSVTEATAADALAYHIARKAIPYIDMTTTTTTTRDLPTPVTPSKPNGMKLEMFIFDVFERIPVNQIFALAVERSAEFTAVKNAKGSDSPATARRDMTRYHHQLITTAGGHINRANNNNNNNNSSNEINQDDLIEISPLITYEGEGLSQHVQGKTLTPPILLS